MGFVTPLSVILALAAPPRRVLLLQTFARLVLSLVARLARSSLPLRAVAGGRGAPFSSFSGCGRLTGACSSLCLGVSVPFEIKNGSEFDLIDRRVQAVVLKWIRARRVWFFHSGTVCARLFGRRYLIPACVGCLWSVPASCFEWCASVGSLGCVTRSRTRPPRLSSSGSRLALPCVGPAWSRSFTMRNCRFGTAWLKPTRIVTNLPDLAVLGVRCAGGHTHVPLRGQVRIDGKWVWRTSLAGAYPPALCWRLASLLASVAPKAAWRDGQDSLLSPKWQSELRTACRLGKPEIQQLVPSCPARFSLPWPRGAPEWGTSHKAAPSRPA